MKKIIYLVVILAGLLMALFSSCSGDSYAKKLENEKKAIDSFIQDNGISVIYDYPADHKFADNQYYKDNSTGLYFRVIDAGDDKRPVAGKTDVYIRYDTIMNLLDREVVVGSNMVGDAAMDFVYGREESYYNTDYSYYYQEYMFLSNGMVAPFLKGLGNNSEVSIIVPFLAGVGSSYQAENYIPLFFKRLRYTFTLDLTEEPD
ncbi:DUF4827 family protein [Dysgonomonas sp. 511]|uniref:DUF4827 family protein n=1 Tax=Dysgonomonas sp. 511 TaxID=2302930 RepID=UPI0013D82AC9|nr:DUF4827 family protein [Dysgonomonas sp. 511]NDV79457.1 DUF4827 family protein [Dysgonomonas sp. 511]